MTNYIGALVDELFQLGIREVVISPGSRSTPLAVLFCEHDFHIFVTIDEGSAAFFALGIAKERGRPVVLVCTSGSVLAHYYPAIIEAKTSQIPLIILTADRPHELRQVGAPQTIDQLKFYQGYVKFFEELALPSETDQMYRYVRNVMDKAYASILDREYGVAHINIPLREPLSPDLHRVDFSLGRLEEPFRLVKLRTNMGLDNYNSEEFRELAHEIKDKKGVILCGGDAYADYHKEVLALAESLKAPILADPISNFRNFEHEHIIDSYDAFLKREEVQEELKPEYIIHFGQTPISKRLQQFISKNRDALYWQIGESFQYKDPTLSLNRYILAHPRDFATNLLIENEDLEYLHKWQFYQRKMRGHLNQARALEVFFEGKILQLIQDYLEEESRLIVANSMAIRYVDYFWQAGGRRVKILCNRGANGIDGTISTALGISTSQHPSILLTGDLAFIHDLNGLLLGKSYNLNLTIVVLNNNGGGIFQHLEQKSSKHFDLLFRTSHDLNFSGLETLFGLKYYEPNDYTAFEENLGEAIKSKGVKIINIHIDPEISKELHDLYTCL